ncbi:MAG TPA: hypothetical protein VF423_16245 [Actinomycetes bacterium]
MTEQPPGWEPPPPGWGPQPGQPNQPGEPAQPWPQPGQPGPYGPPGYGQPPTYHQPPAFGQQPGYGQPPGYGPPRFPSTSGKATTVMVLGIVSLVLMVSCGLGFIPAVIALVMAPGARREIEASGGWLTGESQLRAGKITSLVTLVLTALAVVALVVLIAVGIAASDETPGRGGPSVVTPG